MSFAKVYSAQTSMLDAHIITIEADLSRGLHAFSIVGLPDKAVEEARDRFAAAIKNSGFTSPKSTNQKIVVSLAPADLKKEGANFDLGIALAYLLAAGDMSFNPEKKLFLGELSLDGELRPLRGVLPLVREAKRQGFTDIFVPEANAREAALIDGVAVFSLGTLSDIIDHLNQQTNTFLSPHQQTVVEYREPTYVIDFADVRGQETAKRGLEIAAAGGHNVAMYGPPGTGKTMLAKAFTGILPPLLFDEVLEVTGIHSVAGALRDDLVTHPPLRSPHHTASHISLVGGGTVPRPGEITLAHRGVLFLDEFPEFERRVLEALRQPLEDRVVSVSRARGSAVFPANFILLAAMNPCPCGNFGTEKTCVCAPANLERYRRKLSGPIIDRIDLWLDVAAVPHEKLSQKHRKGESSSAIRERVHSARERQRTRFGKSKAVRANSDMGVKELEEYVPLAPEVEEILKQSAKQLDLSARAYHKVIKLARTIADLESADDVSESHILEALQYRPKQLVSI